MERKNERRTKVEKRVSDLEIERKGESKARRSKERLKQRKKKKK